MIILITGPQAFLMDKRVKIRRGFFSSIFSAFRGASLSYDYDLHSMIENKWEQIIETRSYDLKASNNNSNKLSLLDPSLHYLSPPKFMEAIHSYHIKKIDHIFTNKFE